MHDINQRTLTPPIFYYKTTKSIENKKIHEIDFILLLWFGFYESTYFSTRFNRFLVEKSPVPRREKQYFSTRKK